MTKAPQIHSIHIASDQIFTETLAEHILAEHAPHLPDLTQVYIFMPNAQAAQQMRLSLCKKSSQALIGGYIGSLEQWLNENISPSKQITKHINQPARQLLMLEALKQYPELFSIENHWQVCDSLLDLFDELSLSQHQWLNESTPVWIEHLQQAYQADKEIAHLNQEAKIIQTLWQAWQEQLNAMQLDDDSSALKNRLLSPVPEHFNNAHFYIIGHEQFSPLQQAWCEQLSCLSNVHIISQGETPESKTKAAHEQKINNYNIDLLNNIYNNSSRKNFRENTATFIKRTESYKNNQQPCFLDNIKLYDAQSSEQETQAVDLKVRMSLLAGKSNIAVVTENRKLARRLRALLERADVNIQDTAGWALATTSAATVLERWLECIEQDFAYQPLLDLLKSPFFCDAENYQEHLNLVYRFEQDIVLHENIANDLQRYKSAINNRHDRLNLNISSTAENLLALLNTIELAAENITRLFQNNKQTSPEIWLKSFMQSIQSLEIFQHLSNDIAGLRVQQELEKLNQAHNTAQPDMDWQDFRTWIASTLEREQFKPHEKNSAVKIMNMQQAQYCQFDTLIIAGANMLSLPGSAGQLPFFNQSVRQVLQLKNWQQQKEDQLYQFQQLLFCADDILITWQAEKNGEWMQVSPWVSSLQDFSQHAFNKKLRDEQLSVLLEQLKPITNCSETLLESINTVSQALPIVKGNAIPIDFSASRHQRLIDCPYKFFAADVLKLKPLERISHELMKSEYGENVHLILHAFHQQCPGLPAPFAEKLSTQNKNRALSHIEKLSKQVFESHIEDSIQHRGWLERWMQTAEAYIDWQIVRQQEWDIFKLEQHAESPLSRDIKLVGRLDRIDQQNNQYSIIDYKTGASARQQDIDLAENIQLTSYASLLEDVCNVIYLKLDKGEVRQTGALEGEALAGLKSDTLQRLQGIISEIQTSRPLPAWGDTQTCSYCDMHGLCRKQMSEVNDIEQT